MHVAQLLAAEAIDAVLTGRNLSSAIEAVLKHHSHITPQQRGAMQDLSYGTLRHYGQLQALLSPLLQKPLSNTRLRCLLLVALYQLQQDRAGAHTVVDQAVQAAGSFKPQWAKGLVNAVLRNFLRQRDALLAAIQHDDVASYSYPQWWINKLRKQYPQDWQAMLLAGNQHPPMSLRVNLRQTSMADYVARLDAQGISADVVGDSALLLHKPLPVERIPGFSSGEVSVQDAGAQLAAPLLDAQDGMRVLDACCAPGGKTGHLLELAALDLLALDSDALRLQRVKSNLDRLNLQATLLAADAAQPDSWWDGRPFDRILADVPCTASGIVRRHVDIKWLRREADVASFAQQQARILPALWQLLAKGGKLLYVTCSVFHEENQSQIDGFIKQQVDARQLPLSSPMLPPQGQLHPAAHHDGFFYAMLQKI
ncbi:16S rRNA (cytosine(967)-C(5))-methyltransferase RsmB [Methylobacillus flagellatus]|uniref:16S rRNA (cytosine(967)-C(5))-methyltransferase RsmB n=1 Tax=Methylobacillus flagellatus TaxID=405 RepID=UPI0010F8609B|nr:16S rRNA (cytosine(967)-C(5))-methyltransferase RsmB [Methylobacillus flagellatus]